jgi:hypothetical protein
MIDKILPSIGLADEGGHIAAALAPIPVPGRRGPRCGTIGVPALLRSGTPSTASRPRAGLCLKRRRVACDRVSGLGLVRCELTTMLALRQAWPRPAGRRPLALLRAHTREGPRYHELKRLVEGREAARACTAAPGAATLNESTNSTCTKT